MAGKEESEEELSLARACQQEVKKPNGKSDFWELRVCRAIDRRLRAWRLLIDGTEHHTEELGAAKIALKMGIFQTGTVKSWAAALLTPGVI